MRFSRINHAQVCEVVDWMVDEGIVTHSEAAFTNLHDPDVLLLALFAEVKQLKPYADEYKVKEKN